MVNQIVLQYHLNGNNRQSCMRLVVEGLSLYIKCHLHSCDLPGIMNTGVVWVLLLCVCIHVGLMIVFNTVKKFLWLCFFFLDVIAFLVLFLHLFEENKRKERRSDMEQKWDWECCAYMIRIL